MPVYLDNAATTRVCPEAARAALLPNTFLQALVYRVLTGPVLPEVIEK